MIEIIRNSLMAIICFGGLLISGLASFLVWAMLRQAAITDELLDQMDWEARQQTRSNRIHNR